MPLSPNFGERLNLCTIHPLNKFGCIFVDGPPVSKPPKRRYQCRSNDDGYCKLRHIKTH